MKINRLEICWKLHACTDEEAEEDGKGVDASSLLSCPVEGHWHTLRELWRAPLFSQH